MLDLTTMGPPTVNLIAIGPLMLDVITMGFPMLISLPSAA